MPTWCDLFQQLINEFLKWLPIVDRFSLILSISGTYARANKRYFNGYDDITQRLSSISSFIPSNLYPLLLETDSVISGGFILSCIYEYDRFINANREFPFNDVDIMVPRGVEWKQNDDDTQFRYERYIKIHDFLKSHNYVRQNKTEEYNMDDINPFVFANEGYRDINVAYIDKGNYKIGKEFVKNRSDIKLTSCYFDGIRIWYYNIKDLIYRKMTLRCSSHNIALPWVNDDRSNHYLLDRPGMRYNKYYNKGFQITVTNYVKTMKDIIEIINNLTCFDLKRE